MLNLYSDDWIIFVEIVSLKVLIWLLVLWIIFVYIYIWFLLDVKFGYLILIWFIYLRCMCSVMIEFVFG